MAQEQIKGFPRPRYKKFSTRNEAEEFVRMGQQRELMTKEEDSCAKKARLSVPGMVNEPLTNGNGIRFDPATGPLPPGVEDGFDPNVLFDPSTGKVVYKTISQKTATKMKPMDPSGMLRIYTDGSALKNGSTVAAAGVGVYFGPEDKRFVDVLLPWSKFQLTYPLQKCIRAPQGEPPDEPARRINRYPSRDYHCPAES